MKNFKIMRKDFFGKNAFDWVDDTVYNPTITDRTEAEKMVESLNNIADMFKGSSRFKIVEF